VGAANAAERDVSLATPRMAIGGAVQGGWCGKQRRPARRRGTGWRAHARRMMRDRRTRFARSASAGGAGGVKSKGEESDKIGVHAHIAWLL
jgi:hypothetical protein